MILTRLGSIIVSLIGSVIGSISDDEGGISIPNLSGRRFILFIGQSNVNGGALINNLSLAENYNQPYPNVYQFDKLASNSLDPIIWDEGIRGPVPLSKRTAIVLGDAGGEIRMMRRLDHSIPQGWLIGKFAIGSTQTNTHWLTPGGVYPGIPPRLANQIVPLVQSWETITGSPLSMVVFSLGESDALAGGAASANHQANMTSLINLIRTTYPNIPVLINQCCTTAVGTDVAIVRAAQASLVGALTNMSLVNVEGLNITTQHYHSDGYYGMGDRDAIAIQTALSIQSIPYSNYRYFGTGLSVQFTDLSDPAPDTIASYAWNFGDTTTSTSASPLKVYASPGTYPVSLQVTGTNGRSETNNQSVIVATPAWTVDATANKACPANLTEFNAFLAASIPSSSTSGPPQSIWNMQDATGIVVADSVSAFNFGVNNSPTFQSITVGWTRFGLKFTDGTSNTYCGNTTTTPNQSLTSTMLMTYMVMPAANPAVIRGMLGMGNGNACDVRLNLNGRWRIITSSTNSAIYDIHGTTQPVIIQINLSTQKTTIYTEQERYIIPFQTPANSRNTYLAGFNASASASTYLYTCQFAGAAAEKTVTEIRAMLRCAGWNPQW